MKPSVSGMSDGQFLQGNACPLAEQELLFSKASGRTLTSTDVPTIGLQSLQAHIGGSAPVPTIADAMGFHPWPASDARPSFIALFALP